MLIGGAPGEPGGGLAAAGGAAGSTWGDRIAAAGAGVVVGGRPPLLSAGRRWPTRSDRKSSMATLVASAERTVGAPADAVYGYIADMREHHSRFLPEAFSDFRVESGGVGAGTITRFSMTAGGRTRQYRMRIDEPEPGRVLTESDTGSSLVTTFTVSPAGDASQVQVNYTWDGAGGVGGVFERLFAPRVMRGILADELNRLDAYARERRGS
jgi:Polyketide cyclase / dehydrase and lipid transport